MSNTQSVTLVHPDSEILQLLKHSLAQLAVDLFAYQCPQDALSFVTDRSPDVLITAQDFSTMQGAELLSKVKSVCPQVVGVVLANICDFGASDKQSRQAAATGSITVPYDLESLVTIVASQLQARRKVANTGETVSETTFHGMHSANPAMHHLFQRITKAARTSIPLCISGEKGTGKELVAKACHIESRRNREPFLALNCADFHEHLVESQLFGHVKGAFAGATTDHIGALSAIGTGTLFLDEVTALSLPLQAKLLRVIQERSFSPVGSHKVVPFSAQLVTASSTTLTSAIERGEFRADLCYRLNIIPLVLPPLRERGGDIRLLAENFLQHFSALEKKPLKVFSDTAMDFLLNYRWPGNVRQLKDSMHSLVILSDHTTLDVETLSAVLRGSADNILDQQQLIGCEDAVSGERILGHKDARLIRPILDVEREAIEQAIAFCDGNVVRAATLLEVAPSTIYRKQKRWD